MAGVGPVADGRASSDLGCADIVAAVAPSAEGDALARELQRTQARVRRLWPVPARLPADTDLLVAELVPELAGALPWMPGQPSAALLVVASAQHPPDLKLLRNCAPHAVLHRPF